MTFFSDPECFLYRLFVLKMNWNVILPSSLDMPMQRYTSVKMIDALDPCAISKLLDFWFVVINVPQFPGFH